MAYFNMNMLHDAVFVRVSDAVASGTTTITTDSVDMQGYNSVIFVASLGDVEDTSVLTLTPYTASDDSGSDAAACTSVATYTAGASDADNALMLADMNKPRQQYAYATLTRATAAAAVDGIIAILYNAQEHPVTQDDTVIASAFANDEA